MKKLFYLITISLTVISCGPSFKVSTDYDKEANFSSYKSYSFTKEAMELPLDDINRSRILKAVETQMAAKGFTKSDNSDVWVDLKIKTEQKQTATATGSPYGGGYGYRWGGGFSTTTINVENYTDGTLFVDIIDASKKQLVWQGRAVGTLDPDASSAEREYNINTAVAKIFTKYPPGSK